MHRVRGSEPGRTAETKLRRGSIVAIVGGKGGVGKTTLALNLAIRLAARGRRTLQLDAEIGVASMDILLGLTSSSVASAFAGYDANSRRRLTGGPLGLRILCGTPADDAVHRTRLMRRLAARWDVTVLDGGTCRSTAASPAVLTVDRLVLVTTPEPAAVAGAYATLKCVAYRGFAGSIGLVVNLARSAHEAERVARRFAHAAREFLGLEIDSLGHVSYDRHVSQSARERVAVAVRYPRCPASACIDDICERLWPRTAGRAGVSRVWSHVASLFL
jgi:flagellar biosynthesis protein FlhG